jgi:hypothetical protein
MNEKKWLSTSDPVPMFDYLEGKASDRKSRLFAVACARRVTHLLTNARCRKLIELAKQYSSLEFEGSSAPGLSSGRDAVDLGERSADEPVDEEELNAAAERAYAFTFPASDYAACFDESSGPFDTQIGATGSAAEAASYTCKQGYGLNAGALCAARAIARHRGAKDDGVPDPEELAAQCGLLREIFGNPFRKTKPARSWLTPSVVTLAEEIYKKSALDRMGILADALEEAGCDNAEILSHCRSQDPHVKGCWVIDLVLGKK